MDGQMLQQRSERLSAAIIEMLQANWQRGDMRTATVHREVADCRLYYVADPHEPDDLSVGWEGQDEYQEFTLFTDAPLSHDEAQAVEESVYTATSHNLILDEDTEGCSQMQLGQELN